MNNDGVLTPREAALYLRRSEAWLAKSRMKGIGPRFLRYGAPPAGRVGYLRAELDAWLTTRLRVSAHDTGPA